MLKDKEGILQLARQGQQVAKPDDIIRDPYVLDFLKIPERHQYSESELESRIIEHLQHFLLELGKGFAFIGRQYRITLGNRHHYVDLVFYHRILKCFVLIDLTREEAGYEDVGQMNTYLGYFENEENTEGIIRRSVSCWPKKRMNCSFNMPCITYLRNCSLVNTSYICQIKKSFALLLRKRWMTENNR